MSTHEDPAASKSARLADSDDELDPDEPRTPLWLPLLGLCLFVGALVLALLNQKPTPKEATEAASASASAAPDSPGQ
jgi:hypothetical protein